MALTLFLATAMGVPVSTTHTITGAIVGVGSVQRASRGALGRGRQHRVGLDLHHPGGSLDGGRLLLDQPQAVRLTPGQPAVRGPGRRHHAAAAASTTRALPPAPLRRSTLTDRRIDDQAGQGDTQEDSEDGVTDEEPMTGARKSCLETLREEAREPFDEELTKAEASKRIDGLQEGARRGGNG